MVFSITTVLFAVTMVVSVFGRKGGNPSVCVCVVVLLFVITVHLHTLSFLQDIKVTVESKIRANKFFILCGFGDYLRAYLLKFESDLAIAFQEIFSIVFV